MAQNWIQRHFQELSCRFELVCFFVCKTFIIDAIAFVIPISIFQSSLSRFKRRWLSFPLNWYSFYDHGAFDVWVNSTVKSKMMRPLSAIWLASLSNELLLRRVIVDCSSGCDFKSLFSSKIYFVSKWKRHTAVKNSIRNRSKIEVEFLCYPTHHFHLSSLHAVQLGLVLVDIIQV